MSTCFGSSVCAAVSNGSLLLIASRDDLREAHLALHPGFLLEEFSDLLLLASIALLRLRLICNNASARCEASARGKKGFTSALGCCRAAGSTLMQAGAGAARTGVMLALVRMGWLCHHHDHRV